MKDVTGKEIKINDRVVFSTTGYNNLETGKVVRICKKTLFVWPDNCNVPVELNRHPSQVAKIEGYFNENN